jgi:hypothetical protein
MFFAGCVCARSDERTYFRAQTRSHSETSRQGRQRAKATHGETGSPVAEGNGSKLRPQESTLIGRFAMGARDSPRATVAPAISLMIDLTNEDDVERKNGRNILFYMSWSFDVDALRANSKLCVASFASLSATTRGLLEELLLARRELYGALCFDDEESSAVARAGNPPAPTLELRDRIQLHEPDFFARVSPSSSMIAWDHAASHGIT